MTTLALCGLEVCGALALACVVVVLACTMLSAQCSRREEEQVNQ